MADVTAKLKHLLPHWVDHNAAHLESFRQWQQRAGAEGLTEVSEALRDTVDAATQVDAALRRALEATVNASEHRPSLHSSS